MQLSSILLPVTFIAHRMKLSIDQYSSSISFENLSSIKAWLYINVLEKWIVIGSVEVCSLLGAKPLPHFMPAYFDS